ncbi:MAG: hypothetical protein HW416_3156 [Chloroflexi bacterium]|nr:hypothetical protein [Chloroflexota bacterium]
MNIKNQPDWLRRGAACLNQAADRVLTPAAVELALIASWSFSFLRPFLTLDPTEAPMYREYLGAIQPYHFWTRVQQCGWCALWQGNVAGGYPGVVDPLAQVLNPLVMLPTLGWGVVDGSKLGVSAAILIVGLAQWWLGNVLGMGRIARVWSAGMAIVAGGLLPRIEPGPTTLLSLAASGLVLPLLLLVARNASLRSAILLGASLAFAAIGGPGYIQIGLLLTLPSVLLLIHGDRKRWALLGRRFALAALLGCLLAAPFLIPFLHFAPEFAKQLDMQFKSAQPFAYIPLNLVISSYHFYITEALEKTTFAWTNTNYIGWVPVLLAVWGLVSSQSLRPRREILFLAAFALLALWSASAAPMRAAVSFFTAIDLPRAAETIGGIRFPSVIQSLAVPPILALAGLGLDRLLRAPWSQFGLALAKNRAPLASLQINARWLMIVPLAWALYDAYSFSKGWTAMSRRPELAAVVDALRTPDLQVVGTPFGEQWFAEQAVGAGLKVTNDYYRTWGWRDRRPPEPILEASRNAPPPGTVKTLKTTVAGVGIYAVPGGLEYATVAHLGEDRTVCTAQGIGGDIGVTCNLSEPGILTVKENNWSGWKAYLDEAHVPLAPSPWLEVSVPAGTHRIEFRYLPWDMPLGLLLCLAGLGLALVSWRMGSTDRSAPG